MQTGPLTQYLKKLNEKELRKRLASSPSLDEMVKFLHVTDCGLAIKNWKDSWAHCPVCGASPDEDNVIQHLDLKTIPV